MHVSDTGYAVCPSALADVTKEIRCQIDKRHTTSFLVPLDHSKAFDTAHHSILKLKLKYMCYAITEHLFYCINIYFIYIYFIYLYLDYNELMNLSEL